MMDAVPDALTRRLFTLDSANRMLPLVRRIVEDIVRDYAIWQDTVRAFELATIQSRADAPDAAAEELQKEAERLAKDIDGCIRELAELGVELKGFEEGLVDFPGESQGRPIYLCWRLGEDSVQYWHEIAAGFAGRQPMETLATH